MYYNCIESPKLPLIEVKELTINDLTKAEFHYYLSLYSDLAILKHQAY